MNRNRTHQPPNHKCTIRFLSDAPAEKDAFGPHKRTARDIGDLVSDPDVEGNKAIALTGPWGSGKSTVIRPLVNELKAKKEICKVFVFDSWVHQGDPLRRSFLEELSEFLTQEGWLLEETICRCVCRWSTETAQRRPCGDSYSGSTRTPQTRGWNIRIPDVPRT